MKIIKTFPYQSLEREFSKRRMTIVLRSDGFYTIGDEYYYRSVDNDGTVLVEGWASTAPSGSSFENATLAEQEVQSIINRQADISVSNQPATKL
jgi:hypothetical protein